MIDLARSVLEEFASHGAEARAFGQDGFRIIHTNGRMNVWRAGNPLRARGHYLKNLAWRAANVEKCREYRRRYKERRAAG